jgi:putative cell wall-binding protein
MASAVVTGVQSALPAATVTSITGANVYAMSRNVANALESKVGDMSGATAIITVGYNFPDAIGVAPLACGNLWPVILTDHADDSPLHSAAQETLSNLGISKALKVGTYVTLPGWVTGLANLSGGDRYYTNANVADWARIYGGVTYTHCAVATGDKFPDALASGPYLSKGSGILLLSPLLGPVPAPISSVVTANKAEVYYLTFVACVEPVISQVKALLQ